MKKLFIPLRREWYSAFASGAKCTEYRAYGPRWNGRTCWPGRGAIISCGYSGGRIAATIKSVSLIPLDDAPPEARELFPAARLIIAITLAPV